MNTSKKYFLAIFILFLIIALIAFSVAFGANTNAAIFSIMLVICIVYLVCAQLTNYQVSYIALTLLTLFLPTILSIIVGTIAPFPVAFMVGIKETLLFVFFISLVIKANRLIRLNALDLALISLLIIHLIYYYFSQALLITKMLALKEWLLLCICYFTGRYLYLLYGESSVKFIKNFSIQIATIIAIFAIIAYISFSPVFWEEIGVSEYFKIKFSNSKFLFLLQDQMPSNFFTYFFHVRIERAVFPLLDAPSLSRFLSFPIGLLIFSLLFDKKTSRQNILILIFLLVTQALTIGRSGIIITLLIALGCLFLSKVPRFITFFIALFIAALLVYFVVSDSANTARHLKGLLTGYSSISFWGNGLGSAGQMVSNYAYALMGENSISESYLGAFFYQFGIFGTSILSWLFFLLLAEAKKIILEPNRRKTQNIIVHVISVFTMIGILLSSSFGNSALSMVALLLPATALGMAQSQQQNYAKEL